MDTSTVSPQDTATPTDESCTPSLPGGCTTTRIKASRLLALLLASAILATGITVGSGTRAEAAPAFATTDVCFQAPFSLYGTTYWGPYNRPVILDVWLDGQAHQVQTYTPGTNGCIRVNVVAGYYWRFRVYHREAATWYIGQTGWQYARAGYSYNFGTLRLSAF